MKVIDENKSLNSLQISKYLIALLPMYIIYVIISISIICIGIYIPYYLNIGLNAVKSFSTQNLFAFGVTIFILAFIECILGIIMNELNVRLSSRLSMQIEYDLLRYIKHSNLLGLSKYDDAYLTQRINNDAVCVGDYIIEKIPFVIANLLTIAIIIPIFFITNILLGFSGDE